MKTSTSPPASLPSEPVVESRVGVPTPPTVSESRVDSEEVTTADIPDDISDDYTVKTSNCSNNHPPTSSPSLTRASFDGKKVPSIGTRFSQRLKDLQSKQSKHIPNWQTPYYRRKAPVISTSGTPFRSLASHRLAAQHIFESPSWHQFSPNTIVSPSSSLSHIYDTTGRKLSIDKLLTGPDAHIWNQALSNKFGRLIKGNNAGVAWTDTMEFITKEQVPSHKKVTYCSFVCDLKPFKKETHRIRLVVGGDKLECSFDTSSPAASMLDTKILCNSVISDANKGARFLAAESKTFF